MRFTKPLLLLLLLSGFIFGGCKKNTTSTCNGVPVTAVSISIDLTLPQNNPLTVNGGSEIFYGGYANYGVMVYRYTSSQFNAFDCTCPYDGTKNSKAIVAVQKSALTATCPVCGSVFVLADGSVSHGPATCGLKRYNTNYDGVSNVTVSN